jgi:hypothetical protein
VSGLTVSADTLKVEINRAAADGSLVDYKAQGLEIGTGTLAEPSSLTLSLDAGEGVLTRATGNLNLDVFGFVQVSGGFGIEKKTGQVTLADIADTDEVDESATPVAVDMLLIGANGLNAFAGVNGGQANAIGLNLSDVNLGLAVLGETLTPAELTAGTVARSWISLQAEVGSAAFVGVDGLAMEVSSLNLAINRQAALDDSVVDYSAGKTDLTVRTGPTSDLAFDIDGARGALLRADGHLKIDAFGFVQLEGDFAIDKASAATPVTLSDGSTTDTTVLRIGGSNLRAFAGLNGGTSSAIGLELSGVDFGLALIGESLSAGNAAAPRSWTSLQASAEAATFVGVDGLKVSADTLTVEINRSGTPLGAVVDYSRTDPEDVNSVRKTELTVATSASDSVTMSMDGAQGQLLRASGNLDLDVFGFFQARGGFAIEKRTETFYLNDGNYSDVESEAQAPTLITTDLLTIGGSGIDAFAGLNGGSANAMGLSLQGVDFGLALATERLANNVPGRSFTTLKATAETVGFVGVDDFDISATDLSVEINRGIAGSDGAVDVVIDHGLRQIEVLTGTGSTIALDSDGSLGELTRASGNLSINAFNFMTLQGFLALEKSSQSVTLSSGEVVEANALTVGGGGLGAFVGINGGSDDAIGVELTGADFGLAMFTDKADVTRTWTSLQATANSMSFTGIDGLNLAGTALQVSINQAGKLNDQVVDYGFITGSTTERKTQVSVDTSTNGDTLTLSLEGVEGEVIKAAGNLDIDLFGFFSVEGGFAIEQRSQNVTLSDGSVIEDAQLVTIGGHQVSAFAGVNGGSSDEMGLSLGGLNFGLALISDPDNTTRSFTSLQATATTVGFVGLDDLTLRASNVLVNVNKGITLAAEAQQNIRVNTQLQLDIPLDLVGTLTLHRGAGSAAVELNLNTSSEALRASLKTAFGQLPGVGAANVSVTGDRYSGFTVEFVGALAGVNVADITVTAQGAAVSYGVSTSEQANAGVSEIKKISVQALRSAPAPVTVSVSTSTPAQPGLTEINDIVFTAPSVPGAYDVFFMTDGVVQQVTGSVQGVSELQRLTLSGDTTVSGTQASSTVSQVQAGGAGQSAAYGIIFKAEKVIQEYELFLIDSPAQKVRAVYRGDTAVATTISEMRMAYATLYKGLTGGVAVVANVEVTLDSAYAGKGDRYIVRFVGALAGKALPDAVFKFHLGSKASSSTGYLYTKLSTGSAQSEIQKVDIKASGAGNFTLTLVNGSKTYTTTALNYGSNAAAVRYALNAALGSDGSVEVSASSVGSYQITFGGALAGSDLSSLVVNLSNTQTVPSGSFTLNLDGQVTRNISYVADGALLASRVQAELARLSNIGAGNVLVSYNAAQSTPAKIGLDIRFTGSLSNTAVSEIVISQGSLVNAVGSVRTVTDGVASVNQSQRVVLGSEALRLGYQLSLTHLGKTYTTAKISGAATQLQIQTAINSALAISGAQFSVSKSAADLFTVSAGGSLAGQSLNLMALQVEGQSTPAVKGSGVFVPNNVAQNLVNLKQAYADLLQTSVGNISVVQDASYRGGQRYVISFVGTLDQTDIAGKAITFSSTAFDYSLVQNGASAIAEVQRVAVDRDDTTAGVFRLSLTHAGKTYTTANIALGASAANVQSALRAAVSGSSLLSSLGTVNVFADGNAAYLVSFAGALAGTDVAELQVAALNVNPELPSGNFQISLDGVMSAEIAYTADKAVLAARIQTALLNMAPIGAGNVSVSLASGSAQGQADFVLTFQGALAKVNVGDVTSHFGGLTLAVVQPSNITQGESATGELQRIALNTTANDIGYTLSLTHGDVTVTTAEIRSDMSRAEVQALVTNAMAGLSGATATVEFFSTKALEIRFGGSLLGVNVANLVATNVPRSFSPALSVTQAGSTTVIEAKPQRSLVVDYATGKTALTVSTGSGSSFRLSMDGAKGELLQASGFLDINVYGFVAVQGNLAVSKTSQNVKLASDIASTAVNEATTGITVDVLTIGGTGLNAFAGVNGGYTDQAGTLKADAMGLSLSDVEFGLALMSERADADPATTARKWTTLQATAGSVGFVGLGDDLTIQATGVKVDINKASAVAAGQPATPVVDYGYVSGSTGARKTELSVATSGTSELALTLDGAKGELLQASGTLDINVYGFVSVYGDLAVTKTSQNVKLASDTAGTTVNEATTGITVDVLTIGGNNLNAFAGVNGGYQKDANGNYLLDGTGNAILKDTAMGLALSDVDFGLAMLTQQGAPTHKWTTLQATAGSVGFVGLGDDLTIRATGVQVDINQASLVSDAVVDYGYVSGSTGARKTELSVATSGTSELALTLDGAKGELLQASGTLDINVYGFVTVQGELAVSKTSETVVWPRELGRRRVIPFRPIC